MTVGELIEELKNMPQDAIIFAEGEQADKLVYEEIGNVVRIFKTWDVDFVTGYMDKEVKDDISKKVKGPAISITLLTGGDEDVH